MQGLLFGSGARGDAASDSLAASIACGTGLQSVSDAAEGRAAWARIIKLTQPERDSFHRFLRDHNAAFAQGSKLLQLLNDWQSNRETAVTA